MSDAIKNRLQDVEARFKFVPEGENLRDIAAERLAVCAEALAEGELSILTIERLSGLSRQTLRRLNPVTGEVRWER